MAEEIFAIDEICRACLKITPKKYTLNGQLISLDVTIADMLEFCTSKQLDINETLPDSICTFCFRTIRMAYEFFKQFNNSQDELKLYKSKEIVCEEEIVTDYNLLNVDTYSEPSENSSEQIVSEDNTSKNFNTSIDDKESTKVDVLLDVNVNYDPNLGNEECDVETVTDVDFETPYIEETVILNNMENQDETLYPFICPICDTKFSRLDPFHKHILNHGKTVIVCCRCEVKPEYNIDEYIEHYKEFHKLQCEICQKTLASSFGYRYHMKQHINMNCYKCPIKECKRSFVLRSMLRRHIKHHFEPQIFTCHLCPSNFNTRDSLRYHVKKHLNKKDHLCMICGKSFYLAGHLTHHMYSHTGYKRFNCSICNKGFTTSTLLQKHTVSCQKKHASYDLGSYKTEMEEKV